MKIIKTGLIFIILLSFFLPSCSRDFARTGTDAYSIDNVLIYYGTPVWELAKAVKSQNIRKIEKFAEKHLELLDYQDPVYKTTLLFWAVAMEKYNSAEALLKAGANPDIISGYEGGTALYRAAGFSLIDTQAKKDPKYIVLLIKYGADPNIGFVGNDHNNSTEIGTTPLIHSICCGIEKTKALVEGGADINYRTPSGLTAAIEAILWGGPNATIEAMEYAYYLIVEKHADITKPWTRQITTPQGNTTSEDIYPVTLLQYWNPKPDSEGYYILMDIIKEFERQGQSYRET